jgi:hypothetical protein
MDKTTITEKLRTSIEKEETRTEETINKVKSEEEKRIEQENKIKERKKFNSAIFLMLTGRELTEEEFNKYNLSFETSKKGYNIKKFIEENKINIIKQEETKHISDDLN